MLLMVCEQGGLCIVWYGGDFDAQGGALAKKVDAVVVGVSC